MIFGDSTSYSIRKATIDDLDDIKRLVDRNKRELGFILRPAMERAIHDKELLLALANSDIVGLVHYHHRRDEQTTLYHIVVSNGKRGLGIGKMLVEALAAEARELKKTSVQLKCPMDLSANEFYKHIGFGLMATETGKHRRLNIWELLLVDKSN